MNLSVYCPLWGSENLPFEQFCSNVAGAGYDGVELGLPLNDEAGTTLMLDLLKAHNLKFVAQHWETADPDIDKHIEMYAKRLRWQAAASPEFINSQTGRDWFSFEDNMRILDVADEIAAESGVRIIHETHRGRFPFCAAVTQRFIQARPALRLTGDFSHWCNVSESLLEDQQEAVRAAVERVDHIHARVGHAQGPQVNDPRAPEWQEALQVHLGWWASIIRLHRAANADLTFTPEFGPVPYMPAQPFGGEPLADQWDVNIFMMEQLKSLFDRVQAE